MGPPTGRSAEGRNIDRPVKKRASQACHNCRTRKVKCDLVTSGIPCSNCTSDGVECVVIESRRSRKYRLQKRRLDGLISLPPLSQAPPKLTTASSFASSRDSQDPTDTVDSLPVANGPTQTDHGTNPLPGSLNSGRLSDHGNTKDTTKPASISSTHFHSPPGITGPAVCLGPQNRGGSAGSVSSNLHSQPPVVTLPSYVRPLRPGMRPDDVELLSRRGALSIPERELRDQLLRCFVLFVYPYMPTIDLEDFLGALDGRDGSPKISLVVFQAVMFAGAAYVDVDLLTKAGYASRRAARSDFYQKVKLLYDFDWDVDRVALIQSLLLMNYWYISEHDQKDPWHWLGICISLATSIGMNQIDTYSRKDSQTGRLWRRIWWTCIMRDRITAVSMRKQMRLRDEDFKLPLLTPDDFDTQPVTTSIQPLQKCRFLTDSSTRRMLAEMCVAKVHLLLSIGHILNGCYTLRSFGGSTSEVTMLYTPRRSESLKSDDLAVLQGELSDWYRHLPTSCWLHSTPGISSSTGTGTGHDGADSTENILFLQRSVLRMLFLVATEALNRPQTLSASKSRSTMRSGQGSISTSTSKVKEAADKMAEMIQCLHDRDLIRYLPPLSVCFMLLAIAAFLVDFKTKGAEPVDHHHAGQQLQFHRCIRALLSLRDIWPIADSASVLVGQMMNKSQVGAALGYSLPGINPPKSLSITTLSTVEAQADHTETDNDKKRGTGQQTMPPTAASREDTRQPSTHALSAGGMNEALARPRADKAMATPGALGTGPSSSPSVQALPPTLSVISGSIAPAASPGLPLGLADRYTWTGTTPGPTLAENTPMLDLDFDFDFHHARMANEGGNPEHGQISNGHALHMDIAFAECYSLGDFENSVLDFDFDLAGYSGLS